MAACDPSTKHGRPTHVSQAIKVPMLSDSMRILAALHDLPVAAYGRSAEDSPRSVSTRLQQDGSMGTVGGSGAHDSPIRGVPLGDSWPAAFGTSFTEVRRTEEEERIVGLFDRIRGLFEGYDPPERAHASGGSPPSASSSRASLDTQRLPGPRWKLSSWLQFIEEASTDWATAMSVSQAHAEQIFVSLCGKGGQMGLMEFAEALVMVARPPNPNRPAPVVAAKRRSMMPAGGKSAHKRPGQHVDSSMPDASSEHPSPLELIEWVLSQAGRKDCHDA